MIQLNLVSVGLVEEAASVVLVLRAPDLGKLLVMEVGFLEGRAIALAADGVESPRPLTHDLMADAIERLGGAVTEVQIREYREETFYAVLIIVGPGGERMELDARPSDAIALALRFKARIAAAPAVVETAGVSEQQLVDEGEDEDEPTDAEEGDEKSTVH